MPEIFGNMQALKLLKRLCNIELIFYCYISNLKNNFLDFFFVVECFFEINNYELYT